MMLNVYVETDSVPAHRMLWFPSLSTFCFPRVISTDPAGPEVLDERLLRGVFDSYRSCYVHECGDSFLGKLGNTLQLAGGGVHIPRVGY